MDINGRNVIVTGGGSGIGLAIARALKEVGAEITICGRSVERLEGAAKEHGFKTARVDVNDAASVAALSEANPDVDILVNNAGIMNRCRVDDDDAVEIAEAEFATNVIGPMRVIQAFLPALRRNGGAIVNVSSGLAYVPWPSAPSYCATKAALHSWTRSLRHQLDDVLVFEVLPPLTDTVMVEDVDIGMRKASPDEVAAALVRGLRRDRYEIPVGMSKALSSMSRIAPGFIGKKLAQAV